MFIAVLFVIAPNCKQPRISSRSELLNELWYTNNKDYYSAIKREWDVTGSAVVGNPPANAGDTGSICGPGRSHMPWSN